MPIARVRDAVALGKVVEYLRAHEPDSTPLLGPVLETGTGRGLRLWLVTDGSGRSVGVFGAVRHCRDRWFGQVLLDDLELVPEVAAVIERSVVVTLNGPSPAVEALVSLIPRARSQMRLWFYAFEPQPVEQALDVAGVAPSPVPVRLAAPTDEPQLCDLYGAFEYNRFIPRGRVRRVVRERVRRGRQYVAESGGVVVAAMAVVAETERYRCIDALTVAGEQRGRSIGTALIVAAGHDALRDGVGLCGLRAPLNGMRVSHEQVERVGAAGVWTAVDLRRPRRFRGQNRLRDIVERLEGGVSRTQGSRPRYQQIPDQAG